MGFDYFAMERLKGKMLLIADRDRYEEHINEKEKEMLSMFDCLNTKKSTEENIENFFEVLGELVEFEKGGAKA
jgi:hypothetical protein